jgi:hypothetical protein
MKKRLTSDRTLQWLPLQVKGYGQARPIEPLTGSFTVGPLSWAPPLNKKRPSYRCAQSRMEEGHSEGCPSWGKEEAFALSRVRRRRIAFDFSLDAVKSASQGG